MTGPTFAKVRSADIEYVVCVPHAEVDYIQKGLVERGTPYEEAMLAAMSALLLPGDLVLDVGANIGNHALYLALVAGCQVVAYEPNPDLVSGLERSIEANGAHAQIVLRPVGVGARPGHGVMSDINPENLGTQTVAPVEEGGEFEIIVLDDETFDRRVAAIKIDVEGAELDVLRGAQEIIARDQPLLFIECGTADEFLAVNEYLEGAHYQLAGTYNLTPTHLYVPQRGNDMERSMSRSLVEATTERYHTRALRAEIRELRREKNDMRSRISRATSELDRERAEGERARAELTQARTDLTAARRALKEAEAARTQLREGLAARESEIDELRTRLSELESRRALRIANRVAGLRIALQDALRSGKRTRTEREATDR